MGVSHSMDRQQVDEVLTEFEATTSSISGIEKKMEKVKEYMEAVQSQRKNLSHHAEVTTSLVDGLAESINDQSKAWYDYFASSFEHLAGLVEVLETSLYNLKLEEAPRQIQREFGPLLVPAVVLVLIITASNCYFGFLLASDEGLAKSLGEAIRGGSSSEGPGPIESMHNQMNIIFLFAVAHVSLIGLALVYIVVDLVRRYFRARLRRSLRHSVAGVFWVESDASISDSEASSEASAAEAPRPSRRSLTSGTERVSRRSSVRSVHRTPVSSLLRRVQNAAMRESIGSTDSQARLKDIFGLANGLHRPTQDWIGKCRVKQNDVAVRVAAASTSAVIGTLSLGKRVHVQQAIRGGKGKIWGRLLKPPGWILLADQQAGYRAVQKVKESPTSPTNEDAIRSPRL